MRIFIDFNTFSSDKGLAISIGMFDGVHKGHQRIIERLKAISEAQQLDTAILSFWPHPRLVFNPETDLKLLNNLEEKTSLLDKYGINNLFLQEFNTEFRNLTGEEFVKQILVEKLNVKHLIIGYDHFFGKNKSGNFALLEKMAPEFGFQVEKIEAVDINHHHISSTNIRTALSEGNICKANEMLGYHYSVSGKVVHGKKIGRSIGFPTANIETEEVKLLPQKGAYIVDAFVKNNQYKAMLSIGTNPTVNGKKITTEVYILDFNDDIYDENITVAFRKFLHEEIRFDSLEKLIEKLNEDKKLTELYYKKQS